MQIDKTFDGDIREYWLVFTQGTHLISYFLKKNFSHVYVITRDQYNWIILNPLRLHLDVQIPAYPITKDVPRLWAKPHDTILKVTMHKRAASKVFAYFGLINCVTHVRYLLGLRIHVITPSQLHRSLLKLNPRQKAKHGIQTVKQIA